MSKKESGALQEETGPDLNSNLSRVETDLEIMESHSDEMANIESGIKESMKKWDREYKDSHLHSVPKGKKHKR